MFTKDAILIITGVLGTNFTLFIFWQTSQEVEEEIEQKVTAHQKTRNKQSEVKKCVLMFGLEYLFLMSLCFYNCCLGSYFMQWYNKHYNGSFGVTSFKIPGKKCISIICYRYYWYWDAGYTSIG